MYESSDPSEASPLITGIGRLLAIRAVDVFWVMAGILAVGLWDC
jgi:hypothetical protein